jgi:hypothetical protein
VSIHGQWRCSDVVAKAVMAKPLTLGSLGAGATRHSREEDTGGRGLALEGAAGQFAREEHRGSRIYWRQC